MPSALLSPELWKEVQAASEAGVDDFTLSEDYGVTRESIRKRRQLDKWITPAKVKELAEIERVKSSFKQVTNTTISRDSQAPPAEEVVGRNLNEVLDRLVEKMVPALSSQVERAMTPEKVSSFEPQNPKELGQVIGTLWKISGRDKPQLSIQTNVLNWSNGSSQLPDPVEMAQDVTEGTAEDERVLVE
jgi:hypothetical protein